MSLPTHLEALRDEALRTSCIAYAIQKRWKLGPGLDRAGPCPKCGGRDRFAIHSAKNTFNCRRCGIAGHGAIDLVMATEDVDFTKACEIITGRSASAPVDEQRAAELRRRAEADAARDADEAARYREAARRHGHDVWQRALPAAWLPEGPVARYLALRGIRLGFAEHDEVQGAKLLLREILEHPWSEKAGNVRTAVHTGPAMIAAVQRPDGTFGAVHQTWLDFNQPKGKVLLADDTEGRPRPSKKVLGAKKGGAIRLFTPKHPVRMVMGEGIETTLTALAHNFEPYTAYWAGVDLGNMAGRALRSNSGGQIWDRPALDDRDCFLPPDWCEELVYLCDSDEASNHTEEKVIRGLRRALMLREAARQENSALATLAVSYVEPIGDGKDLNDLVRVQ